MTGTLVAAYHGPAGPDVLTFARSWTKATGGALSVVTVYPGQAPIGMGRTDAEWVAYNREQAESFLAEAREFLGDEPDARFSALASESASHGLHDAMEAAGEGALVVLGSHRTGGARRTRPGSTAERLLQGAPGPVALVPWGYEENPPEMIRRISVAYIDTADARAALQAATEMASCHGAELQVVSVLPQTRVVPGLGEPRRFAVEQRKSYADSLDAALATLPAKVKATGMVLDGPVVDTLADLRPEDTDLLVCGSRGYGPARRVLLGGVSSRLLRNARVPVVVVPRG